MSKYYKERQGIPPVGNSPGKGLWECCVPLWDGTSRCHSLAEHKLLEGI